MDKEERKEGIGFSFSIGYDVLNEIYSSTVNSTKSDAMKAILKMVETSVIREAMEYGKQL
jgi:hypothetical protein